MATYKDVVAHFEGFPDPLIAERVIYVHTAFASSRLSPTAVDSALAYIAGAINTASDIENAWVEARTRLDSSALGPVTLRRLANSQLHPKEVVARPLAQIDEQALRLHRSRILCEFLLEGLPPIPESIEETLPPNRPATHVCTDFNELRLQIHPDRRITLTRAEQLVSHADYTEAEIARIALSELEPERTRDLIQGGEYEHKHLFTLARLLLSTQDVASNMYSLSVPDMATHS